MNSLVTTTFIAKPFYWVSILKGRKGMMKKLGPKTFRYSPFKFCENAKMNAKISATVYHCNICSGYLSLKSCPGSPV
jgi:hypothetical protein